MTSRDQTIIVWHRTDLRIKDNPALNRAAAVARAGGATIQPVFVFDPRFYGADSHACDGRIAFLHECLASLRERYRRHGSELAFLHGNPADRLAALLNDPNPECLRLFHTRHPTARYGAQRDDELEVRVTNETQPADRQRDRTSIEAVPEGAIVLDAQERGVNSREG